MKPMDGAKLVNIAKTCGISISTEQAKLFEQYYHLLEKENKKYNLTRIDGEAVLYDHFIDSLYGVASLGTCPENAKCVGQLDSWNIGKEEIKAAKCKRFVGADDPVRPCYPGVFPHPDGATAGGGGGCPANELLDLGSGAGFPGIPIKILFPEIQLYLLESSRKKHDFLQQLTKTLGLKKVVPIKARAEELGQGDKRETYAWVTARAVASLTVLAELALPLLRIGGQFWAYKGPAADVEIKESEEIVRRCGGLLKQEITYTLPPNSKKRRILVFTKVKEAESRFPRRTGVPQKKPFLS